MQHIHSLEYTGGQGCDGIEMGVGYSKIIALQVGRANLGTRVSSVGSTFGTWRVAMGC